MQFKFFLSNVSIVTNLRVFNFYLRKKYQQFTQKSVNQINQYTNYKNITQLKIRPYTSSYHTITKFQYICTDTNYGNSMIVFIWKIKFE
jgi:hypothetical protein